MNWRKLFGIKNNKETTVNSYNLDGIERRKEKRVELNYNNDISNDDLLASIQIKPNEIIEENKLVPSLDISGIKWDKPVILIMDDEELVNFFLKQDLVYFETIAKKLINNINLNKNEIELMDLVELNGLLEFVKSFRYDNYDIISVSSEFAAFAIRRNIKVIKRVDFAILDISLGGTLSPLYNDDVDNIQARENLNGIDIAYDIMNIEKSEPLIMIYTGNDLGKYSPETIQYEEMLPNTGGLFKHMVNKDTPLMVRRIKLMLFLAGKDFNEVKLG